MIKSWAVFVQRAHDETDPGHPLRGGVGSEILNMYDRVVLAREKDASWRGLGWAGEKVRAVGDQTGRPRKSG